MQISLNKHSDVPLHEQLAEQLVFLITTKKLDAGAQLPSVRAFARQLGIHHNTVSKSYRDLVARGWLKRQRGSRLSVGEPITPQGKGRSIDLDALINHTIRRAGELGYSLQALRSEVLMRLSAQPPDHILVVEREPEFRQIICAEIRSKVGKRVESCGVEDLSRAPALLLGAQVVAPDHLVQLVNPFLSVKLPCIGFTFVSAEDHLDSVRNLIQPSVIGVVSISKAFLKTARSLLAPVVGRRHSLETRLLESGRRYSFRELDIVFCDSASIPLVSCRRKIQYRLISERCMDDIAVSLSPPMGSHL
ncbi:MAG TPA: GntR family transcriptional regulator [Candidatus Sulfotelmatobacter sp.]|jgi:DNA-binding transcriptional regulator YhcF (GntR family)